MLLLASTIVNIECRSRKPLARGAFTAGAGRYNWWAMLCCVRNPSMKLAVLANVKPSYLQLP